jgi:mRNA interferase MazF
VAGGLARGDIRLYQFALPDKRRPVVVLTRDSAIRYLPTVTVAPITSTIHGVPSEVVLSEDDGMKGRCAVNLHNALTVGFLLAANRNRRASLTAVRQTPVCRMILVLVQ